MLMVHSVVLSRAEKCTGGAIQRKRGTRLHPVVFAKCNSSVPFSQFLLAELNTFYLKFVLWMPPEHYLVLLRLVFFVNVGGVAMREIYDFMDDP